MCVAAILHKPAPFTLADLASYMAIEGQTALLEYYAPVALFFRARDAVRVGDRVQAGRLAAHAEQRLAQELQQRPRDICCLHYAAALQHHIKRDAPEAARLYEEGMSRAAIVYVGEGVANNVCACSASCRAHARADADGVRPADALAQGVR